MTEPDRSSEAHVKSARRVSVSPASNQPSIWLLVAVHAVLSLFICTWSAAESIRPFGLEFFLLISVVGVILAQASLLGIWVAFSRSAGSTRLAGLVGGCAFLELLLGIGLPHDDFRWLAAMTTGGVAIGSGTVRWRHIELRRFPRRLPRPSDKGRKLSIRRMMLFTFVAAVVIALFKAPRNADPDGQYLLLTSIWSLCSVVVGLFSVWAGLGRSRPMLRSVAVVLFSSVIGALLIYGSDDGHWRPYVWIISEMVIQAAVLLTTLLMIRSCGYRLVRRSAVDAAPLDGTENQQFV